LSFKVFSWAAMAASAEIWALMLLTLVDVEVREARRLSRREVMEESWESRSAEEEGGWEFDWEF